MNAKQLRQKNADSWNWQREWFPAKSANERVLACYDDEGEIGEVIPMQYALQLMIDLVGKEELIELIRENVITA